MEAAITNCNKISDVYDITCSLVCYKNNNEQVLDVISSFFNTNLKIKLYVIDNSPFNGLKDVLSEKNLEYIHNPHNPGFSKSHNLVINKIINKSRYHLIINPDIYYKPGVLESIIKYMDTEESVGLVMPKILFPNGNIQYLAKLLPTPFNFFVRRLMPIKRLKKFLNNKFELRFSNYNNVMDVPYLSGCFMVFKIDLLKKINGFDENFFLHFEDVDITRRSMAAGFRTIFYPYVSVYHNHQIKKTTNIKTMLIYLKSAVYYFNKWGWFFDNDRSKINKQTLEKISFKNS